MTFYLRGANLWTYVHHQWTSKSTPHCIFVGYSETENLFELWDIEKRAMIRKRDVIFWEHELGHLSLMLTTLTYGISIYPQLNSQDLQPSLSALASRLVRGEQDPVHYVPSAVPPNDIPLPRPPVRQTIQKLHPEPKQRDRIRQPGEPLQFIPWQPPPSISIGDQHDMYWITTVDTFDEQFMASIDTQPEPDTPPVDLLPDTDIFHLSINFDPSPSPFRVPVLDSVPNGYKQAMKYPRAARLKAAMEIEYQKLINNNTWILVDLPPGRNYVSRKKTIDDVRQELSSTGCPMMIFNPTLIP